MEKKYKVLTGIIALLLVLAILVVSISASSYTSTLAYLMYRDAGESVLHVERGVGDIAIDSPNTSWGFFHDLELKKFHTYEVDITLNVEFHGSSTVHSLPGELVNISFLDDTHYATVRNTVDASDFLLDQKNKAGDSYSDLVSMSFDSYYDSEKEVTVLNYHLSFSTASGFIDNLNEGIWYMMSFFDMHPEAVAVDYLLSVYEVSVNATYDPEGDIFEESVVDKLGDAVSKLDEINTELAIMKVTGSTQVQKLEELKATTETLVAQNTELSLKVIDIKTQLDKLPDDIGNQFEQKLEEHAVKEYEAAEIAGNEALDQLVGELGGVVDTEGIISSFKLFLNSLSYVGRTCPINIPKLSIPAMEGVTSEPIVLMNNTTVNLADYIYMIPESIMKVVQWFTVIGIVLNAIFTLMKLINRFLQGKSVGDEDGD